MTNDEQEARSMKFEPSGTVNLRQLSSGLWAMYPIGGVGSPFWIGPANDIVLAYAQRPIHQRAARPTPVARSVSGINPDELGIDL